MLRGAEPPASSLLQQLPDADRQRLEQWLAQFDRTWTSGRLPVWVKQLPPVAHPWRLPALVELVRIDLRRHAEAGTPISLETYLASYPELRVHESAVEDLAQTEQAIRQPSLNLAGQTAIVERSVRPSGAKIPQVPEPGTTPVARSSFGGTAHDRSDATSSPEANLGAHFDGLPERFGRFQIVRKLGEGAMGVVYLAQDTQLDRPVALKVPHLAAGDDAQVLARFHQEARAASALRHPNICPVYDVGIIDGVHYLTMAFIDGRPLSDILRERGQFPQLEAAALVRKLALALEDAHRQGVIHRDLKPSNIMIDAHGEPIVMDFGLARQIRQDGARLTASGAILGTPSYMAPEQLFGEQDVIGPISDVYSLGVILYELLTGHVPFEGPLVAVIGSVLTRDPNPPSSHRSDLIPALEAVCRKAMARKPADRFSSMAALAEALALATPVQPKPEVREPEPEPEREPEPEEFRTVVGQTRHKAPTSSAADSDGDWVVEPSQSSLARSRPSLPPAVAFSPTPLLLFRGHTGAVMQAVFSPDGQHILTGASDRTARVWDVATGQELQCYAARQAGVWSVAYSPEGSRLAIAGFDKLVKLWDVRTGQEILALKDRSDSVQTVAFSPDGRFLATTRHQTVKLWDAATGQLIHAFEGHEDLIFGAVFSPAGRRTLLASASYDQTAKLWDMATGEAAATLTGHTEPVLSVAFSADGLRLASTSADRTAKVWDVQTGQELLTLRKHTDRVGCVAFHPRSQILATGGWDQVVHVWDLSRGEPLGVPLAHQGRVNSVSFSPDGSLLLTACADQLARLWGPAQ